MDSVTHSVPMIGWFVVVDYCVGNINVGISKKKGISARALFNTKRKVNTIQKRKKYWNIKFDLI